MRKDRLIHKAKKSVILQQDQSDCGVCCLATLFRFYNGDVSLERLRELSGTSKQGTTFLGLHHACKQLGVSTEAMEAEDVENLKELKSTAILHVLIDARLLHYVVFFGFENDKIIIGDPAKGIVYMTKEELSKIWVSKTLLSFEPSHGFVEKHERESKKINWIYRALKDDIDILVVSLFLGVVISLLSLSTAIFSQKLIDEILPSDNFTKLAIGLVLLTLLLVIRSFLIVLRGNFLVRQAKDFNNRIITSFFGSLLRLPKPFFDSRKIGDMIARMNDTRRIQTAIGSVFGNITIDFLGLLVAIVFLFTYSKTLGFLMLLSVPIYFLLAYKFNKSILDAQKSVMGGYAYSESNFVDSIQGIGTIKSSNHEEYFEANNKTVYGLFQDKLFSLGKIAVTFSWFTEALNVVFTIVIFGIASWLVLNEQFQIGQLVAVLSIAGGIAPALSRLVIANIQLQEATVAFDRMSEFTFIEPEYQKTDSMLNVDDIQMVKFENVSFRFNGRKLLLKNISFNVAKGEMIALLGESGIGKSTIIQLLQKFYQPEGGNIFVNGLNIQQIDTHSWRSHIGVVPQEVKIFNGTLLFNIVLSNVQKDIEEAVAFCESVGLSKYFNEMPQGYLTLIGEEGINISGGQKQLVGIARVLWNKPKLLLLDEATSGMDRKTEKVVMDIIRNYRTNMATILVTHKIKTASIADRIYNLEDGVVSSSGTPVELLKSVNFYSESLLENSVS
jgi:ATP-binding cassette subfamily B protein